MTEAAPIERWGESYSDAKAAAEAVVMAAAKRGILCAVIAAADDRGRPFSFFVTPIIDDARLGGSVWSMAAAASATRSM